MSIISIVVAVARDGAIGVRGGLPFHIREDLRHFKAVTLGHPVIMGRKTFESLPGGALPGRRNIVITRSPEYTAPDAETASSLQEAMAMAADADELMIIGGGEIYRQALPLADRLYLTDIDAPVPDADTFFPEFDRSAWTETDNTPWTPDERNHIPYRFVTLTRRPH